MHLVSFSMKLLILEKQRGPGEPLAESNKSALWKLLVHPNNLEANLKNNPFFSPPQTGNLHEFYCFHVQADIWQLK